MDSKKPTVKGFTQAEFSKVLANLQSEFGPPNKHIVSCDFGKFTAKKPRYAETTATTNSDGNIEYRWTNSTADGQYVQYRRFSHTPLQVDFKSLPLKPKATFVTRDLITLNDPSRQLVICYELADEMEIDCISINGTALSITQSEAKESKANIGESKIYSILLNQEARGALAYAEPEAICKKMGSIKTIFDKMV